MQVLLGRELAASPRLGPYTMFTVADFLAFCAIYIPYTHLPPLAVAHGVTPAKVATISKHYLRNIYSLITHLLFNIYIFPTVTQYLESRVSISSIPRLRC